MLLNLKEWHINYSYHTDIRVPSLHPINKEQRFASLYTKIFRSDNSAVLRSSQYLLL